LLFCCIPQSDFKASCVGFQAKSEGSLIEEVENNPPVSFDDVPIKPAKGGRYFEDDLIASKMAKVLFRALQWNSRLWIVGQKEHEPSQSACNNDAFRTQAREIHSCAQIPAERESAAIGSIEIASAEQGPCNTRPFGPKFGTEDCRQCLEEN
ncbi:hypothetical protein COOONC_09021, partial [Cooperia oncophora]